jgi:lysophospholipase L1-like esterase
LLAVNLRRSALVVLSAALALLLLAAGPAGAAKKQPLKKIQPPARVKIGRVELTKNAAGRPTLLVAVRYPLEAAGRQLRLGVHIQIKPGTVPLAQGSSALLSAGAPRLADRRRSFTYVHEIDFDQHVTAAIKEAWQEGRVPRATVEAQSGIDIDGDGKADIRSKGVPRKRVALEPPYTPAFSNARGGRSSNPWCASFPQYRVNPGEGVQIRLPSCDRRVRWRINYGPAAGSVKVGPEALEYTAPKTPGTQTIGLNQGTVVVKVVNPFLRIASFGEPTLPPGPVVRAMGDSVTAGFGYYSDGSLMGITSLPECKPFGAVLDDACSSNSTATKNGLKEVPYAPDYGLAKNISWAAQWANEYGATNYKNFAISGTEPSEWAPGGSLYPTTQKIEAEDPDYILMTIGANPILSETLFGLSPMECALESDIFGGYKECVEAAFKKVNLEAELAKLYKNLVENTQATIYVMEYPLSVPSSALLYSSTQIAEIAGLMDETIIRVVGEVNSPRLRAIAPPHFNVGVNLAPVYPSTDECHYLGEYVDGPSVQSTPSQVALRITNPLTFCGGPEGGGPPWVISGDTGIHPSATGYAQMASQVPPPAP